MAARHRIIERAVGKELFEAVSEANRLVITPKRKKRSPRSRLASLKQWMGPHYFNILVEIIETGSLSRNAKNTTKAQANILESRDALAMVIDWRNECIRWGVLD